MAKYILGLELGNSNIKLLECKKQGTQVIIEKSEIIPTPEGVVSDGVIVDTDEVYKIISKEMKKQKYKSKDIVAVIKSSQIITRDIKMDLMAKKDMDAILALQYQEHLLVNIEAYQITYKVIKTIPEEERQELLLVAAPNTLINPLLEVATKLKMRIRSINIASDAITNFFSKENPITAIKEEEVMVIDIGGSSTTVTIISEGIGVLNRDIPFGLDAINPLITREFGAEKIDDIEEFKAKHVGLYEDNENSTENEQNISSIIKPMIEYQLVSEIQRFLQFHFSRGKNKPIKKIYIVGGGSYLKNIDKYIANLLDIPCVSGIKLDQDQIKTTPAFRDKGAYFANILGLISEYWG